MLCRKLSHCCENIKEYLMEKNIAVIWGDCSSPEIVKQTLRVLD